MWIDAGTATSDQAAAVGSADVPQPAQIIVGLEVLESPISLRGIMRAIDPLRVVVSLDLFHGRPWIQGRCGRTGGRAKWLGTCFVWGVRRLILLDVVRWPARTGSGTVDLVREVREVGTNRCN